MDALHRFNNLLTTISRYQALEKLYSMRLAQFGPNRLGLDEREASYRTGEFIKGIKTREREQQGYHDLDASHRDISLIKPICEFIDEQLMKKPENETECVILLLVTKYIWRGQY